jgi:hypothetical protein
MSFSWGSLTSQTPNIQKLASKKDVDGLIKALDYRDHKTPTRGTMIVEAAATALGDLRDDRALAPLLKTVDRLEQLSSDLREMGEKLSSDSGVATLEASREAVTHALRATKGAFVDIVAGRDVEAVTKWTIQHPGEAVPQGL